MFLACSFREADARGDCRWLAHHAAVESSNHYFNSIFSLWFPPVSLALVLFVVLEPRRGLVYAIAREADSVGHYRMWHAAGHKFVVRVLRKLSVKSRALPKIPQYFFRFLLERNRAGC